MPAMSEGVSRRPRRSARQRRGGAGLLLREAWNGKHPRVARCETNYAGGIRHNRPERRLESFVQRHPTLGKWALRMDPPPPDETIL